MRYYFVFTNNCAYEARVTWDTNSAGRSKQDVRERVARQGGDYSRTLGALGTYRSSVLCPGTLDDGGYGPFITWCTFKPGYSKDCETWTVD